MLRVFQHHIAISTLTEWLADSFVGFVAMLLAAATVALISPTGSIQLHHALVPAIGFALLMSANCAFVGLYRQGSKSIGLKAMLGRAMIAVAFGGVLAYIIGVALFADQHFIREVMPLATGYLALGLLATRSAVFSARRASMGARRVLIVGTGPEALSVASDLRSRGRSEFCVVGFYPAGDVLPNEARRPGVFSRDIPLQDIVRHHSVDEIIVAMREQRGGKVPMDQLLSCRIRGTPVLDLAGFYERARGEVPIDSLKASWLVYGHGFVQHRTRIVIKRAFDIVSSSILLVLASPVMLFTALAVKLESDGPVIYKQERVGLGGRTFWCLKFRSMRSDAEKDGVARWATKNDSRITRVGAIIRKTRIDELPQLISVLKGEMSMVGPRPERPSFVEQLKEQIPFYDVRHSVKPGVTGWAQVRYSYGASVEDARKKHQYDLYYVKNNSLFLDLLVLIETVSVVLFREGAH